VLGWVRGGRGFVGMVWITGVDVFGMGWTTGFGIVEIVEIGVIS